MVSACVIAAAVNEPSCVIQLSCVLYGVTILDNMESVAVRLICVIVQYVMKFVLVSVEINHKLGHFCVCVCLCGWVSTSPCH